MKLDESIVERLNQRIDELSVEGVTSFALLNRLKDIYVFVVRNGYLSEDDHINLAAYLLYNAFLMEE